MRLLALFGPFTHRNDRFPYSFIYFNLWNPYNFIYLKHEKGSPFGRSLPVWAIIGRIPGGFWNYYRLFRTGAQGWNSEGEITYFCVKQDTIVPQFQKLQQPFNTSSVKALNQERMIILSFLNQGVIS